MDNLLTDRAFWENYWTGKKGLDTAIQPDYIFGRQLQQVVRKHGYNSAIELGGFPGYYSVYLKKYLHMQVTLLDYFVHPPVLHKLLEKNGLKDDDVAVIEADLFNYTPQQQYGLVLSAGLIEHFDSTEDIIARHAAFLQPGGTLFITLPNFKGLNGWLQKRYDAENYSKHNIKSMDLKRLSAAAEAAGLQQVEAGYFGCFGLWLENEEAKPRGLVLAKNAVKLAGKIVFRLLPVDTAAFSPYIMLKAVKPAG